MSTVHIALALNHDGKSKIAEFLRSYGVDLDEEIMDAYCAAIEEDDDFDLLAEQTVGFPLRVWPWGPDGDEDSGHLWLDPTDVHAEEVEE